jgi:hypothetical protein
MTKLIVRDKAMSTFWIVLANHLKGRTLDMNFGCSKEGSNLVYSLKKHSFSCWYGMSNDISMHVFFKHLENIFLVKISRKGETLYFISWVNPTWPSPFPRQYPTSTLNLSCATVVPSKYSVRHLSPFFENHFLKTKTDIGLVPASSTVHDRGLGYSNRFTLCRGCTLHPHHWDAYSVGILPT